ncbi:MAG: lytic murein transglycosylase, partial [Mariprofundaceae bacterium]
MRLSGLIAVLLMSWAGSAWAAVPADIEQQRQWFLDARAALKSGHDEQFEQLKVRLKDYPLFPYLELWQARSALDLQQDSLVETVLARHADIPEAVDLRLAWIKNLAERGQWPHVAGQLILMPGVESRLPEIAMVTLWRTGHKDEALAIFGKRWRRGESHADISLALEHAWQQSGHPNIEERWERISVLAKRGRWQQVNDLAAALPLEQQQWLKQWKQMQQDPGATLAHWPAGLKPSVAKAMFGDALHRLARRDVHQAWQALSRHRHEAGDDFHVYRKRIALRAAKQHVPEAAGWLAGLPRVQQNNETRAWQVRLYLLQQDNRRALAAIRAMPEQQQKQSRWMFWKAQALNSLGRKTNARRLYDKLAEGRGYYSFLSAEHLGQPYQFSGSDFESDAAARNAIAGLPAMQRAYEWWMLGDAGKANREWYLAMNGATPMQWKAAAGLAMDWGWYDRMIYSAYRAG